MQQTKIIDGKKRAEQIRADLKKQAARITDAIALQINVVANGRTLSGIQAKMMTSVDQHIVTQIRQRFACSLFIVYPLSYPSSDGFFAYIWI